jgi:phosphatidylglycerophosphate synthase
VKLVTKSLERAFFRLVNPLVGWLLGRRVHPNTITTVGVLLVVGSAVFYGLGAVRWGGALLLCRGGVTAPGVAERLWSAIACMVAVLAAMLVSYARARAEGLGLECKVGIVQRAERLLGIGVTSVVFGSSPLGVAVLQGVVVVLALLSAVTVVQRFRYVYRVTGGA